MTPLRSQPHPTPRPVSAHTDATPGGNAAASDRESAERDRALLAAASKGDLDAIGELYDRHASALLGLAVRILGSRRDGEDLVHDVFVEAWERAKSYDPKRASVKSWLNMRLRSRAIDRLRALGTARNHTESAVEADETTHAMPSPERRADHLRASQALASLPEEQRRVVELSYFEGLSGREIAERCGVPVGTVKSRLSTALSRLRRVLPGEEIL